MDLFNYCPRISHEVRVGDTPLGGTQPLRLQSMATVATTEVDAAVAQCKSIIRSGADYVRFTTQGTREVEALRAIHKALRQSGITTPLVADVHFNPDVADAAARIVEKVRINPGNYIDPARRFKHIEYTDEEYAAELTRLEERFLRLLAICREHGTALRIGVNHGSLSDRIMSRYGDTPQGIVESCMEFLRICQREAFANVVVSIKASDTAVMVRSVRLLCKQMKAEGMDFPLHLGVTEAGEGEDGRIKSAAGIGALLADGIGDTIRVSLSEPPEAEIPVAHKLAAYVTARAGHPWIYAKPCAAFDYELPERRPTRTVGNIGGNNAPVIIAMQSYNEGEQQPVHLPDYIYCGAELPPKPQQGVGYIVDLPSWQPQKNLFPAFTPDNLFAAASCTAPIKFLFLRYGNLTEEVKACLRRFSEFVVVCQSAHKNPLGEQRAVVHELWREGIAAPVVFCRHYVFGASQTEDLQLCAAADFGALIFDGVADGVMLLCLAPKDTRPIPSGTVTDAAFALLQATGARVTRTEYISCPGCGRTLYDLPTTITRVKAATSHLKGLKIAIMGCIVNGPGEMADADYGYVGAGRGRISLYKGRQCIEKNIPEAQAVDKLLALIETDRQKGS